ncbi:hypothetical protein Zm00014a_031644 [Zea mays]|uniref:Uncharacterized protein n=1 Tax=Zea mays TaxID=4577 RepID=A0A3L6EIV2_MAIZE|nr:hypothetical protein Zm00014a_031644 [Zea mays]
MADLHSHGAGALPCSPAPSLPSSLPWARAPPSAMDAARDPPGAPVFPAVQLPIQLPWPPSSLSTAPRNSNSSSSPPSAPFCSMAARSLSMADAQVASSSARPFLLFPDAAARSPCSDCSHGVQVPAPSPLIQKTAALRRAPSLAPFRCAQGARRNVQQPRWLRTLQACCFVAQ